MRLPVTNKFLLTEFGRYGVVSENHWLIVKSASLTNYSASLQYDEQKATRSYCPSLREFLVARHGQ